MRGREMALVACAVFALSACAAADGSAEDAVDADEADILASAERHRRDMTATPSGGEEPLLATSIITGAGMNAPSDCQPPAAAEAAAAVLELNQAYIDAAREGDVDWFDEHMAEAVIIILGNGQRLDKAAFLSAVEDDTRTFRSLTVRDVTVRAFGGTVQVDADAPWELKDGMRGVSRYIDTYAWLDCRWQVISAQINSLPAEPEAR